MFCSNCGSEINSNSKFCGNCGTKVSVNQGINKMKEIVVSTGDIKKDYDVLRLIHLFHHSLNNKDRFGEKNLSVDDVIDHIIEEMKEEASEEGGDAIINLRVDFEQLQLSGTQYFVYGTLVKFK
ncbi:MAG: hypothetical protein B6D44_04255 [Ignavibacteriales bacterium UTCHB2]|jgi:transcriptional regulator NrdR family protein|nr:MAG: hypothetical protein B6D44_04255 [Ignavibacteriales bacterium UTCHB2]